ncbi:MAG: hypothetical protein SP1CHLAM54_07080 [Chlamydiia bacterium]|nr:hypothetical protein [Chlamydiia bacterium]MCH9615614.1 hypothetical protein [Chlamydiia bacterium]MCH9628983.1 hypothetical protein [Chlamydiia bacterium]
MKFFLSFLLICSFIFGNQAPTPASEVSQMNRKLVDINFNLRRQQDLGREVVEQYHDDVVEIYDQARDLKKDLNALLDENQQLLDQLLAANEGNTKSGELHTEITSLEKELEGLKVLITQVISLQLGAERALKAVNSKLVDLETERLFHKLSPVYKKSTWLSAYDSLNKATKTSNAAISSVYTPLKEAFKTFQGYVVLILFLLIQVFLHWYVRRLLKKKTHTKTHIHIVYTLLRKGVLPFVTVGLLGVALYFMGIGPKKHPMLTVTLSIVAFSSFCFGSLKALLRPKCSKCRITPFGDVLSKKLHYALGRLLILALVLMWLDLMVRYTFFTEDLAQTVRFPIYLLIALSGYTVLHAKYWKKSYMWSLFRHVSRFLLYLNPVLVLVGLAALADHLLYGLISTIITCLILTGIYYILSKGIASLFREDTSRVSKVFTLSTRGEEILQYWGRFLVGFILLFIGVVALLLIWGMNGDVLLDYAKLVIFGVTIGSYEFSLVNFFLAVVTFLVLFTATRYLQKFFETKVFPFTNFDRGLQHALKIAAGYIGVFISLIISLNILGLQFKSLLYVIGGLSVGIGLGFQPIVTNFVSGIIMLIERPIRIGDVVDLPEGPSTVTKISVRATEMRTPELCTVFIPNTHMINNVLKNWTHENSARRAVILVSVAYGTDPKLVHELLLSCASVPDLASKRYDPLVLFDGFGDYGLDFKLFIYTDKMINLRDYANQVKFEIDRIFKDQQIEIPYPRQDIFVHNPDE